MEDHRIGSSSLTYKKIKKQNTVVTKNYKEKRVNFLCGLNSKSPKKKKVNF